MNILPIYGGGNGEFPRKGLKAHWNFSKHVKKDILTGIQLEYEAYKYNGEYINIRNLKNGKTSVTADITLPYNISDLKDFTVVLKYCLIDRKTTRQDSIDGNPGPRYNIENLDGELLLFHRNPVLRADDGELEIFGFTNDSMKNSASYVMDVHHDENGEFCLVASYEQMPKIEGSIRQNFKLGIGCCGEMKYYYAESYAHDFFEWGVPEGCDDKIMIHNLDNMAYLTEIWLYKRILTDAELAVVMGADTVRNIEPELDTTSYKDWRLIVFAVIILLVIIEILFKREKNYGIISARMISRKYGCRDSIASREQAEMYISELWREFGSRKNPVYPKDYQYVKKVFESALATGCTDKDIIKEYNRIVALINACVKTGMKTNMGLTFAIFVFLFVSISPLYHQQWLYDIQKNIFVVNGASILTCILASFGVTKGAPGERIKGARFLMGMMNFYGSLFGGLIGAVGNVVTSLIIAIISIPCLFFYIAFSCVYEFVIIIPSTGQIVANGTAGLGGGLFWAVVIFGIIGCFLNSNWDMIIWLIVLITPIISYLWARLF